MNFGFVRVACYSPNLIVANCEYNASEILNAVEKASKDGVSILNFPELSITGYTCGDLFLQHTLIESAKKEICKLWGGSLCQ